MGHVQDSLVATNIWKYTQSTGHFFFQNTNSWQLWYISKSNRISYLVAFGCRTTKIATSNDWHQSPLHEAWHNLIDAKCRWRSNRLDGAGSNREPLGQRKEMKILQVAIDHEICCYTAQLSLLYFLSIYNNLQAYFQYAFFTYSPQPKWVIRLLNI